MSQKVPQETLWFDTETTGVDPWKHDIVQIAGIITIDGIVKEEFEFKCKPIHPENVEQAALDVTGFNMGDGGALDISLWPEPSLMYKSLLKLFEKYINKFDKKQKFLAAGHNPSFDLKMLQAFFKHFNNNFMYSYMGRKAIDTWDLALHAQAMGVLPVLENMKLSTLAAHFGIPLIAHDALNDIRATRQLEHELIGLIQGSTGAVV